MKLHRYLLIIAALTVLNVSFSRCSESNLNGEKEALEVHLHHYRVLRALCPEALKMALKLPSREYQEESLMTTLAINGLVAYGPLIYATFGVGKREFVPLPPSSCALEFNARKGLFTWEDKPIEKVLEDFSKCLDSEIKRTKTRIHIIENSLDARKKANLSDN